MDQLSTGLAEELADHVAAVQGTVAGSGTVVADIADRLLSCFDHGGKLLICGNGGSAADAQHLAAEFVNRLRLERMALPAIALTTDTSVLTCIGNDLDFSEVFVRQIDALGQPGDVLLVLSTSGGSANVLGALRAARRREMFTVGFTGEPGRERIGAECDLVLVVPSHDTARIQECHQFVYHVLTGLVERHVAARAASTQRTALG